MPTMPPLMGRNGAFVSPRLVTRSAVQSVHSLLTCGLAGRGEQIGALNLHDVLERGQVGASLPGPSANRSVTMGFMRDAGPLR